MKVSCPQKTPMQYMYIYVRITSNNDNKKVNRSK